MLAYILERRKSHDGRQGWRVLRRVACNKSRV